MPVEELLIDADGHILEPPDLWEKNLEAKYRDRAIRIKRGADGREYLEIDNKISALTSPTLLASLGGMKKLQELGATVEDVNAKRRELLKSRSGEKHRVFDSLEGVETVESYVGGAAYGAMDAKERLALLETEGMAKTILYPTIGLLWEAEVFDADLSDAYCRAYNRWIADFCRDSGGRLVPIAHISLADPAAAARELERAAKDGCKGAFVCPFTTTRKPHGHADHDPVFAAAQDLGIPLAIHPTLEPPAWGVHQRFDNMDWADWFFDLFAAQGVSHAFATMFQYGVFDRFPRLRTVVLESGAGWIGYWLDRGDAIYRRTGLGGTVQLKERPSYYFKRQCYISGDPDERSIAPLTKIVAEDRFFWASDYPHPDHPGDYIEELRGMVEGMSSSARRGVLGENVARAYNLP
ncbi:MAG TPA: amidohydrolase family protein [Candidatus Binataceae bacterium]|nr:amidohydrolase family protein [Candidatus Binataceae bacterium]